MKYQTLKTYIETKFVNDFIRLSKSFAKAFIFFVTKLDKSFYLCINYYSLNDLIIKNQYPLILIGKF